VWRGGGQRAVDVDHDHDEHDDDDDYHQHDHHDGGNDDNVTRRARRCRSFS